MTKGSGRQGDGADQGWASDDPYWARSPGRVPSFKVGLGRPAVACPGYGGPPTPRFDPTFLYVERPQVPSVVLARCRSITPSSNAPVRSASLRSAPNWNSMLCGSTRPRLAPA